MGWENQIIANFRNIITEGCLRNSQNPHYIRYDGDALSLVGWVCDFISKVEDDFRFLEAKINKNARYQTDIPPLTI